MKKITYFPVKKLQAILPKTRGFSLKILMRLHKRKR